jgi:tryptophan synthase alpha chain
VNATTASPSVIDARFSQLRAEGRRALVAYVTAGHPTPVESVALMRGLEQAGVDILEVGVPFSDPLADGPVIQRSSQIAIEHGMSLNRTLELIAEADHGWRSGRAHARQSSGRCGRARHGHAGWRRSNA